MQLHVLHGSHTKSLYHMSLMGRPYITWVLWDVLISHESCGTSSCHMSLMGRPYITWVSCDVLISHESHGTSLYHLSLIGRPYISWVSWDVFISHESHVTLLYHMNHGITSYPRDAMRPFIESPVAYQVVSIESWDHFKRQDLINKS